MKQPKIRFKGFQGEWEETTYGETVTINSGMDYKHLSAGNIPVYGTGGYMLSVNKSLSDTDAIGIGRKGTIDKPQLLKAPFWTVDTLFFMTPKNGNNLNFLFSLSQRTNWRKYDESTGVPSLSKVNIAKIDISLPLKDEQQAIVSYFQHLDSLIQSTAKKIELLKQTKVASLQSMFPQEGETTPRVRFKGFEGEWQKVAIKDIASFSKGHGYSKSDLRETGIPIILYGRMYTKYEVNINNVDTFVYPMCNSVYTFGDEVIMPASGETPEDISCASAVHSKGIILGGDLNVMRFNIKEYNTTFIALSLSIGNVKKVLSNMAQGKSVVHLHNSDIEKISILMPSYKEQQAIASYFTSLDAQISLQTQRLEKLKQIKSACLDNMFV